MSTYTYFSKSKKKVINSYYNICFEWSSIYLQTYHTQTLDVINVFHISIWITSLLFLQLVKDNIPRSGTYITFIIKKVYRIILFIEQTKLNIVK